MSAEPVGPSRAETIRRLTAPRDDVGESADQPAKREREPAR